MNKTLLFALTLGLCSAAFATSVITTRLDDPKAIYLDKLAVDTDCSAGLQVAIDKAAGTGREGIVFVPAGRYPLTRTVYVWPGVRLIGYGATRPVFVLPPHTPGFQKGIGVMVMFTGLGPSGPTRAGDPIAFPPPGTVPPNPNVADANPNTFYSAMTNIDFEIGDDNPAAVAVRFHVAQHAFLTHMDFHIGSGMAALYQVGNEAEDLHFYGGRYAILTENTSPAWQFTLIDSSFEGQRESAIREHEAGLTLIRDIFRNVPTAIDLDPGYPDQLWVKDEYTLELSSEVGAFRRAILCIERWGVSETFWNARRKYLYVDDHKYWHMGNASLENAEERPTLINRTWLDVARYRDHAKDLGYDGEILERLVVQWNALLDKAKRGT